MVDPRSSCALSAFVYSSRRFFCWPNVVASDKYVECAFDTYYPSNLPCIQTRLLIMIFSLSFQNFGIIEPSINNKDSANNMSLLKFFAIVSTIRKSITISPKFGLDVVRMMCGMWVMDEWIHWPFGIDKSYYSFHGNPSRYRCVQSANITLQSIHLVPGCWERETLRSV